MDVARRPREPARRAAGGRRGDDVTAEADAAVVLADDAAPLRATLVGNKDALTTPSVLWVAYPKANRTDINRASLLADPRRIRPAPGQPGRHRDVWSALRFRPLKPGEEFAPGKSRACSPPPPLRTGDLPAGDRVPRGVGGQMSAAQFPAHVFDLILVGIRICVREGVCSHSRFLHRRRAQYAVPGDLTAHPGGA
jgi:hypothetical protein